MSQVPKDYENFCKPTFLCDSDDLKIKKLAKKLVKNKKNPEEAVKSIFYWVRDKIAWDIVGIVGAKKLLQKNPMYGICLDKANLFIALCRSINIPARYLLTFSCELKHKKRNFPKYVAHVAAEVYLNNKWKIADPTFGKHTQKLVQVSRFGKPSWKKIKKVLRLRRFSPLFLIFIPLVLKFSPSALKMKELIKEIKQK